MNLQNLKRVGSIEALAIINSKDVDMKCYKYSPIGSFYTIEPDGVCVSIDNETGDAWTEEHDSYEAMIKYFTPEPEPVEKSPAASVVLRLMDCEYDYTDAVVIAQCLYPDVMYEDLEKELNKYV